MDTGKTRIFFTTNAGLYFCFGKTEILVDGIHDAGTSGFSAMPEEMLRQMDSEQGLFAHNGTLLFTHTHEDHYDAERVKAYLEQHPGTAVWGPGLQSRGISHLEQMEEGTRFLRGEFLVTAYDTRHSGEEGNAIPHGSFLLQNTVSNEAFFIAGDALLEPELAARIRKECDTPITAFVMIYQLAESKSRAFLEALLPSELFLIHQPQPGDAAFDRVAELTRFCLKQLPRDLQVRQPEPMSWIDRNEDEKQSR